MPPSSFLDSDAQSPLDYWAAETDVFGNDSAIAHLIREFRSLRNEIDARFLHQRDAINHNGRALQDAVATTRLVFLVLALHLAWHTVAAIIERIKYR